MQGTSHIKVQPASFRLPLSSGERAPRPDAHGRARFPGLHMGLMGDLDLPTIDTIRTVRADERGLRPWIPPRPTTGPQDGLGSLARRVARVAEDDPPPRFPANASAGPGRIGTLPKELLTIVAAYAGSDDLAKTQRVLRRLIRCAMEVDPAKSRTSLRKAIRSMASRPSILRQLAQLNPGLYPDLPARMQDDPKAALAFVRLPPRDWEPFNRSARPGKGEHGARLEAVSSRVMADPEAAAEISRTAVQADPNSLALVRPELRSEAVCRAAVQAAVASRLYFIKLVAAIPETEAAWRTELLEDLVATSTSYFWNLREKDKTARLCEIAFRRNPSVISSFPEAQVTAQRMAQAASARPSMIWALVRLPAEDDRWLQLARHKGMVLSSLPWDVRLRRDVCEAAVAQDPAALPYVPRWFHDEAFFRQAIEKLGRDGEAKEAQRAAYSGTSPWSQARTAPASGAGPAASIQPWTAPRSSD